MDQFDIDIFVILAAYDGVRPPLCSDNPTHLCELEESKSVSRVRFRLSASHPSCHHRIQPFQQNQTTSHRTYPFIRGSSIESSSIRDHNEGQGLTDLRSRLAERLEVNVSEFELRY
jgi:hypothetical protein